MHKKIEGELVSLAHSILQMKNRDNVYALHEKAAKIYEQLSVLKFVEDYIGTTPDLKESREEILAKVIDANERFESKTKLEEESVVSVKEVFEESTVDLVFERVAPDDITEHSEPEKESSEHNNSAEIASEVTTSKQGKISEETAEKIFGDKAIMGKNDMRDAGPVQLTLDEEIKEAVSADLASSMFEAATKEAPVAVKPESTSDTPKKRSLNEAVYAQNLQIGLNDRIAFVKHLFDDSQEDFNRVISQLNSFNSEEEAKDFLKNVVKPDYNWEGKEDYEERLYVLLERRFS